MKRAALTSLIVTFINIIFCLFMWFLPQLATIHIAFKIILTIIFVINFIKDISLLVNCKQILADHTNYKWKDRKRTFLGLPFSFTKYKLTTEKLIVDKGFFNTSESEIRLYRITDLDLSKTFGQRLLGIGTITVHSSDKTDSLLVIERVKRPDKVKELISDSVEAERVKKRVSGREIIDDCDAHDHECNCGEETI